MFVFCVHYKNYNTTFLTELPVTAKKVALEHHLRPATTISSFKQSDIYSASLCIWENSARPGGLTTTSISYCIHYTIKRV